MFPNGFCNVVCWFLKGDLTKPDVLTERRVKQTAAAACRCKRPLASRKTQRETRLRLPCCTRVPASCETLLWFWGGKKKKKCIIQHLRGGRAQRAWRNESFKNYTQHRRSDCHYPLRGNWNVRQHSRPVRELAGGNASGLVCIPLKPPTPILLFHSKSKYMFAACTRGWRLGRSSPAPPF